MIEEVQQFSREWEEFWYQSESEAREFMRPQFTQKRTHCSVGCCIKHCRRSTTKGSSLLQ